jgi:hypothetical protein
MDFKRLNQANKTSFIPMYTHRTYIGLLGFLLPVVCIITGWNQFGIRIQGSVSSYYYTSARDLFTAVMVLVAAFLITYRGYDLKDRIITYISGFAAALTALFPTSPPQGVPVPEYGLGILHLPEGMSGTLHLISASVLFLFFAVQSFFLFTKSRSEWRNTVYRICGIIIFLSLVVLMIIFASHQMPRLYPKKVILILEIVMLSSFGIAWVIKGKIFLATE